MGDKDIKGSLGFAFCVVYAVIAATLLTILYAWPLKIYLKHETTYTSGVGMIPMDYPSATLSLCMVIPLRHRTGLRQDASVEFETVFERYIADERNWRVGRFVEKVLLVRDPVRLNFTEVQFKDEDFRPVLVDTIRFGICFAAEVQSLVQSSQAKQEFLDMHNLNLLIVFKVPDDLQWAVEKDVLVFSAQITDHREETMLTGPIMVVPEAGTVTAMVKPNQGAICRVQVESHIFLNRCDAKNRRLSDCVSDFEDKKFGTNCRMPWIENDLRICATKEILQKTEFTERIKMEGLEVVANVTDCLKPCERLFFKGIVATKQSVELVFPQRIERGIFGENLAALMVNVPWRHNLTQISEVERYPLASFVGEAGGYLGLFLGLSLWTLFQSSLDLFTAIKRRLEHF